MRLSRPELDQLLELNRLRAEGESPRRTELEERFAAGYGVDRRLATYGSLAPGESNHAQLSHLAGAWFPAHAVRGERLSRGWGAALGFPAVRWSLDGQLVAVSLFVSPELPAHWARLDAFEGPEYLRLAVPVYRVEEGTESVVGIANLYAAREP